MRYLRAHFSLTCLDISANNTATAGASRACFVRTLENFYSRLVFVSCDCAWRIMLQNNYRWRDLAPFLFSLRWQAWEHVTQPEMAARVAFYDYRLDTLMFRLYL